MDTTNQFPVTATHYSLARTAAAVLLVARWMDDDSGATVWTELDREAGDDDRAWARIKARNMHLLRVAVVA